MAGQLSSIEPDEPFEDSGDSYLITSMPASLPVVATQVTGGGDLFATTLYLIAGLLIANRVDPTWKVAVLRRRSGRGHFWRVVGLDYGLSDELADVRLAELASTWRPGQHSESEPIPWRDRSRIREASLGGLDPVVKRKVERRRAWGLTAFAVIAVLLTAICILDQSTSGYLTALPMGLIACAATLKTINAWRTSVP